MQVSPKVKRQPRRYPIGVGGAHELPTPRFWLGPAGKGALRTVVARQLIGTRRGDHGHQIPVNLGSLFFSCRFMVSGTHHQWLGRSEDVRFRR